MWIPKNNKSIAERKILWAENVKENQHTKEDIKKPLIKGKFYRVKDSNGGHPSKLFRKNTKKNKYWIVRFTSSPGRHRTKLKHQIDPQRDGDSFVINNPTIEKYEEFSSPYPLNNLRVHKDDLKLVRKIQKKKRWDPRAGNKAAPSESIIV